MSPTALTAQKAIPNRFRIAIAGAGIGGLALALALRRVGFDPVVHERRSADQLRTEGVFLTLAPNGVNALRVLGLMEATVAAGLLTDGLEIFNERGRKLGLMDYASHARRFGAPSVTIGRGALSGLLLDAAMAEGIDLRLGQPVTACEEDGEGVLVSGKARERYDLLVACDGLRSMVRHTRFPDLPQPHYTGLIGTGGIVDVPEVAETGGLMRMSFGTKAFFGYFKQRGGPVLWFNTYPAAECEVGPIADPVAYARRIAAMHADDPLDNARILSAVPAIERNYPIYDMPELDRWFTPRVALMGDAAHAVAPHSGQGASMAIEDALVMAACLDAAATPESAFRRFRALRHERTRTAIRIGRMAGSQKHAQSWLQLRLRDLILPLMLPLGIRAQERMFGFRIDHDILAQPSQ